MKVTCIMTITIENVKCYKHYYFILNLNLLQANKIVQIKKISRLNTRQ